MAERLIKNAEIPEFRARVSIVVAVVCTSLPLEEATERLNREHPTGISSRWEPSEEPTFSDGAPNPCPCADAPDTHKHFLFNC